MLPIDHELIDPFIRTENDLISCHNIYVKGKGGYDGAVCVTPVGGKIKSDGTTITIDEANEVLLIMQEPNRHYHIRILILA
jgi:hypothetical protein